MCALALTVGLDVETRAHVAPLLGADTAPADHVGQARDAAELAAGRRYDLVTCSYPLPDMILRDFVAAVRHRRSASRDAALLVLTLPEMRAEASRALSGGRALVMSRHDPQKRLGGAVRHLLRVEPRRSLDALVTLLVAGWDATDEVEARLVNLSRSGMLLRQQRRPRVGSLCDFELALDGLAETIRGRGEVVRHSLPSRERVSGFALRFVDLDQDARQLIEERLAAAS